MNGESDQPPAVLIGIPDEDASELPPPLQLPRNNGNAKETRQIPNARILRRELNASHRMNPSYQERKSEAQDRSCSIRLIHVPRARSQFLPPVATYAHS